MHRNLSKNVKAEIGIEPTEDVAVITFEMSILREVVRTIRLEGVPCRARLLLIEDSDRPRLRQLFGAWKELFFGMKDFKSRGVNLPEGVSESAFCLEYSVARVLDVQGASSSFDTFDFRTNARQQIKATSVEDDLTSFGPRSVWDEFYWLDFYRAGRYDGSFDVYRIPNELILNFQISSTQTFRDQQKQGRRPRLHVRRQIIIAHHIEPEHTCHI